MLQSKISTSVGLLGATLLYGCTPMPTPVIVTNPADIAKAEGIQQPYQAQAHCNFAKAFPDACNATITSPPSQRLVIEFVSVSCGLTSRVTVINFGTFDPKSRLYYEPTS